MEGEMFWRDRNCVLGRTILMVSLPLHRHQAGVRKQFLEYNNMKQRQKNYLIFLLRHYGGYIENFSF